MDDARPRPRHDRRTFLAGAIAVIAAACSSSDDDESTAPDSDNGSAAGSTSASTSTSTSTSGSSSGGEATAESSAGQDNEGSAVAALTPAAFAAVPICVMTPAQPAGPFPSLEPLNRRDVTEGYPGHPLRLGIRIVDPVCEPIPGAWVEIWHADASGDYSSYEDGGSGTDEGAGTTFLRGFQEADDDGIVEFQTIYPGWYEGRAVHIHATVGLDDNSLLTTQLYFDEAYTETVHATGEYAEFGLPDTGWADDSIADDPTTDGTGIVLTAGPTSLGDGTLGLMNLGAEV